ncbi:MAG TPA: hypothetical protein PL185_11615, partial [Flavobacteriales bacterium]|nr:hypothetical protein [Flavobacteriales bacterium]
MQNAQELILQTLKEKSSLKQDIYRQNLGVFDEFKTALKDVAKQLHDEIQQIDDRIVIEYSENSP